MPTWQRGHQIADPLIFITPGQKLPPQLFIHAAIPPLRTPQRKTGGGGGFCMVSG